MVEIHGRKTAATAQAPAATAQVAAAYVRGASLVIRHSVTFAITALFVVQRGALPGLSDAAAFSRLLPRGRDRRSDRLRLN